MREKKVREVVVKKTLDFLINLQQKCEGLNFKSYTVNDLMIFNHVSKSNYSACKALGIVRDTGEEMEWIKEYPNREMALQVIDYLLHKRKKQVVTPLLPEFATIIEQMKELVNVQKEYNQQAKNNPMLNRALNQSNMVNNSLFAEADTKQKLRNEIAGRIASGIYTSSFMYIVSSSDGATIDSTNQLIIEATDDLITKLYKK